MAYRVQAAGRTISPKLLFSPFSFQKKGLSAAARVPSGFNTSCAAPTSSSRSVARGQDTSRMLLRVANRGPSGGCELSSPAQTRWAARGRLEIVHWLHGNGQEGCATEATDWAAFRCRGPLDEHPPSFAHALATVAVAKGALLRDASASRERHRAPESKLVVHDVPLIAERQCRSRGRSFFAMRRCSRRYRGSLFATAISSPVVRIVSGSYRAATAPGRRLPASKDLVALPGRHRCEVEAEHCSASRVRCIQPSWSCLAWSTFSAEGYCVGVL